MDDIMKNLRRINVFGTLVSGLLFATAVGAQSRQSDEIASLKRVTGNVLVSQQAGLATGVESQRLVKGTRVITTANSEAVIVFDNGCEVRLRENQRFDVDSERPCALLVAEALGGLPVAAANLGFVPLVGAAGGAAVLITGGRGGSTPVSPN
jgi:hypothetical protein